MPLPFVAALVTAGVLKGIGTALEIGGNRRLARDVEREGETERELFGMNAEFAEEQAKDAIARGQEAELRQRYRMRTLLGAQRAAGGGSGVNVNVGSLTDVYRQDLSLGEADADMIRENASREALGFRHEATSLRMQGDLAYRRGRNQSRALRNSAWSSLANYAGDMFSLYQYGR